MKSRSWPLTSSTGPCSFASASKPGIGNGGAGAFGSRRVTPELNTPIVFTRGSAPTSIERKPPHELPIAATLSTAILPLSGEPSRAFSLSAQSTAVRKSSTFACRRGAPSIAAVATTRKPWEATVVRKPVNALLSIAQPPLPQTSTGSVSFFGNASRFDGWKITWPGEPNAPSDATSYGPFSASGAPSTGSAVRIMSGVMPCGSCARALPKIASRAAPAAAESMAVLCMTRFPR